MRCQMEGGATAVNALADDVPESGGEATAAPALRVDKELDDAALEGGGEPCGEPGVGANVGANEGRGDVAEAG